MTKTMIVMTIMMMMKVMTTALVVITSTTTTTTITKTTTTTTMMMMMMMIMMMMMMMKTKALRLYCWCRCYEITVSIHYEHVCYLLSLRLWLTHMQTNLGLIAPSRWYGVTVELQYECHSFSKGKGQGSAREIKITLLMILNMPPMFRD